VRISTSSRPARTLGTGTVALSVGLGLLTGGLGTPQSAIAAPPTSNVSATWALPQTSAAVSRATVTVTTATAKAAGTRVVTEAARHKGKKYKFGAAGPKRFDCSGFTLYVYKKAAGKKLPHKANLQQRYGKAVAKSKKRPGDLIIIRTGSRGTHAGIYAGGGKMWSAPRTGKTVSKQKIWSTNYVVRRLV
jgi:cell wall-associated NlpC family hydrolase